MEHIGLKCKSLLLQYTRNVCVTKYVNTYFSEFANSGCTYTCMNVFTYLCVYFSVPLYAG